jgi:hypothetical protein
VIFHKWLATWRQRPYLTFPFCPVAVHAVDVYALVSAAGGKPSLSLLRLLLLLTRPLVLRLCPDIVFSMPLVLLPDLPALHCMLKSLSFSDYYMRESAARPGYPFEA